MAYSLSIPNTPEVQILKQLRIINLRVARSTTCVQANAPSSISILADGSYQLFYPARGMDGNAITF